MQQVKAREQARKLFSDPIEFLDTVYPANNRDPRRLVALRVAMADFTDDELWAAAEAYARTGDFFPSPAELRRAHQAALERAAAAEDMIKHTAAAERLTDREAAARAWLNAYERPLTGAESVQLDEGIAQAAQAPTYLDYLRHMGNLQSEQSDLARLRYVDRRVMSASDWATHKGGDHG